jgi:hypothetical protein
MQSQVFIKLVPDMITRMETAGPEDSSRDQIQKDLTALVVGLQNPSLPSASRLRDAALRNGFFISPQKREFISYGEGMYDRNW